MASPTVSDSSIIRITSMSSKHDIDGIGELFSHYKAACAMKTQAGEDLRTAIDKQRALALEEFRRAEEAFNETNSVCDDMLRSIEKSFKVGVAIRNGTFPNVSEEPTTH